MIPLTTKIASGLPSGIAGNTHCRDKLLERFGDRIAVNSDLSRSLVSWQSNKNAPGFRWFKFKEGFSTELVRYLLQFLPKRGQILDPFAGTGVAPITASSVGWESIGVEILPVGVLIAKGLLAAAAADPISFRWRAGELLQYVASAGLADVQTQDRFPHIRITERAFPTESEQEIAAARRYLGQCDPRPESDLLALAAIAALEDASWTSKDG